MQQLHSDINSAVVREEMHFNIILKEVISSVVNMEECTRRGACAIYLNSFHFVF